DYINQDAIDMIPEVAVGRVPASDVWEARDFVRKVISYEENGLYSRRFSDWFKRALFIVPYTAADDLDTIYFNTKEAIAADSLTPETNFTIRRTYSSDISSAAAAVSDAEPTVEAVIGSLNYGYGLVNYGGHGSLVTWGNVFYTWNVSQLEQD
nr:hypothetical protein [Gammaproteobacteria bacterium]NIX59569.1 hypothetical protein [candidate division Zixibacteria bacterium]